MTEELAKQNITTIESLVVSHSYEMLALITVLENKGILTRTEIVEVIKQLKNSE